ncbi:DUF7662 domain-containing protein [Pontixanthobacter aquaemixtae]|uniref:DUF7662 domain-containing protein n=1 Tax=Pontixanthobacter aquaemixtae TaxID=1958940 RepID=A0A844ZWN5_9SPHN|nr:hypothetical protein [Pontixanthobacter aquaemixtae]MXO91652.1 hypothetical protein [Pontixanthobacter aquaemixtae]
MSKYDPLSNLLADYDGNEVWLTFNQIGDMIDGDLPDSAYRHRPWWANRTDDRGGQHLAWQSVGWETRDVDMSRERVRFIRLSNERKSAQTALPKPISILEAKEGLAAKFGVPLDAIEISIRA